MSKISRRDLLKALLGGTASVIGTVVLARATPAAEREIAQASGDVARRADRLADELADDGRQEIAFLNGAFRNGGGFRNNSFRNGGGFRNGAFANGGGGFRNSSFGNGGGFRNGGFGNGGFRRGGFGNGGFRNW